MPSMPSGPETPETLETLKLPPLPKSWPAHTKGALVHLHALARLLFGCVLGEVAETAADLGERVGCADCERLRSENGLLQSQLALLTARFARLPTETRPRFTPPERLRALELVAARGWNRAEAARALVVAPPTLSRWLAWAREGAPLLDTGAGPMNKFPDLVTHVVQKLKAKFPAFGKRRIADLLARAGLQLSVTTVGRKLKAPPVSAPEEPPPPAPAPAPESEREGEAEAQADGTRTAQEALPSAPHAPAAKEPAKALTNTLAAKYPGHIWGMDITLVPTFLGFWVPWVPFSIAPGWPFCWHVFGVLDFFSRKAMVTAVFRSNPSAADLALALDCAVTRAGGIGPRHLVSDKGSQFWCRRTKAATTEYQAWCARHGVKPRFGAIGESASIARVERFWRSLKSEWTRLILVPFCIDAMRAGIESYARWYNTWRPHQGLRGATPEESYRQQPPARSDLRFEIRERYPLNDAGGSPQPAERATLRGLRIAELDAEPVLPCVLLDFDRAA